MLKVTHGKGKISLLIWNWIYNKTELLIKLHCIKNFKFPNSRDTSPLFTFISMMIWRASDFCIFVFFIIFSYKWKKKEKKKNWISRIVIVRKFLADSHKNEVDLLWIWIKFLDSIHYHANHRMLQKIILAIFHHF